MTGAAGASLASSPLKPGPLKPGSYNTTKFRPAVSFDVEQGWISGAPDSPTVLAEMAGTTRATVNQVLRAEAERGTVELARGRTRVLQPDELARRAR